MMFRESIGLSKDSATDLVMKAYERPWKPYLRSLLCFARSWSMGYVRMCSGILRYTTLEQVLVLITYQTYRRVECRIKKGNVGCFGQLLMNSFDNSQGTCIVTMILVSCDQISHPRHSQRCKIRQLFDMMISFLIDFRRLVEVSSMDNSVACKLDVLLVLEFWQAIVV